MAQQAEAYFNGKKVKPIWNKDKFSFEDKNVKFEYSKSAKNNYFGIWAV